jgi:hypothetical protein
MPPIVELTWLDAVTNSHWINESNAPTVNHTIGFQVYSDDDYIEVACTYDPESGYWNGSISIPQDNIVTYQILREEKPTVDDVVEIIFEAE